MNGVLVVDKPKGITSFDVVGIPNESMSVMLRLQRWLRGGGSVTINTGDLGTRTYTATLAPDGDVTIERTDPVHIEYTMTFTKLRNTASADMLCVYS